MRSRVVEVPSGITVSGHARDGNLVVNLAGLKAGERIEAIKALRHFLGDAIRKIVRKGNTCTCFMHKRLKPRPLSKKFERALRAAELAATMHRNRTIERSLGAATA